MKKIVFIIFLSIFLSYLPFNFAEATVSFSNIEVYDLINGNAKLKWGTNLDTRAEIYYGLDSNNLDRFMGYSLYDRWHETVLTGLEKDEIYYFKIKAIEESGETSKTFIRTFSTDDMEDTIRPEFIKGYPRIMQITHNAVAFKWATDEKTKTKIYYGSDPDNLSKQVNDGTHVWHTKFIYNLDPATRYYFKFKIIDKDDNYREKTIHLTTHTSGSSHLIISNIAPMSPDDSLIEPRQITLKWETNLIAKGVVYYGTSPSKLKERKYIPLPRKLKNELIIDSLEPNKNYYFEIKAYDSLYNKSERTDNTFSFKTKKLSNYYRVGDLVKGSSSKVYVIQKNGKKAHIKNEKTFLGLNYRWSMIKNISSEDLDNYLTIDSIKNTDIHPDGTLVKYTKKAHVYLIDNGKKRPFFTAQAFTRGAYIWDDIITIPNLEEYKTGDYIF